MDTNIQTVPPKIIENEKKKLTPKVKDIIEKIMEETILIRIEGDKNVNTLRLRKSTEITIQNYKTNKVLYKAIIKEYATKIIRKINVIKLYDFWVEYISNMFNPKDFILFMGMGRGDTNTQYNISFYVYANPSWLGLLYEDEILFYDKYDRLPAIEILIPRKYLRELLNELGLTFIDLN